VGGRGGEKKHDKDGEVMKRGEETVWRVPAAASKNTKNVFQKQGHHSDKKGPNQYCKFHGSWGTALPWGSRVEI